MSRSLGIVLRVLLAAVFVLPILFAVTASLRENSDMYRYAGSLSLWAFLPAEPTFDAYRRALGLPRLQAQLFNTVLLGFVMATGTTISSLLAGYALSRFRFRGRKALFLLMLFTLFIPVDVILPPLFFVVRDLGLIDSFWGLALPFIFSPIGVYLIRQAIEEVPRELDHAAALDGAGLWEVLRTAILPNIRGALIACWLMHFVFVWEWYLWPLIAMRRDDGQLAQVAISGLIDPLRSTDYALVFAAAILTIVPAFVIFAILQRFLTPSQATSGGK
ncbi:carbohydrate ABC transporter permease [Rhizobium metallidurans]|uniref:sn-glycerol-3-phosphate transport system permease protein UgpE n=1 Tax=Rhizobium metallidurans TaxID=1265931 RepID=A0A7W6G9I1_9HYPH|nr:carbohydrate ABC transporter permease [Rhizobium metallidurans]MBB3962952.1 ABC-type glycerol-3-phosphate transport system permease component [Rhizobium metallidurans]